MPAEVRALQEDGLEAERGAEVAPQLGVEVVRREQALGHDVPAQAGETRPLEAVVDRVAIALFDRTPSRCRPLRFGTGEST